MQPYSHSSQSDVEHDLFSSENIKHNDLFGFDNNGLSIQPEPKTFGLDEYLDHFLPEPSFLERDLLPMDDDFVGADASGVGSTVDHSPSPPNFDVSFPMRNIIPLDDCVPNEIPDNDLLINDLVNDLADEELEDLALHLESDVDLTQRGSAIGPLDDIFPQGLLLDGITSPTDFATETSPDGLPETLAVGDSVIPPPCCAPDPFCEEPPVALAPVAYDLPPLRIATVTFQFSLRQRVNVASLAAAFPSKQRRSFRNQASFKVNIGEGRSSSVCVFSNGTVNLAGCREDADAVAAAQSVIAAVSQCPGVVDSAVAPGPLSVVLRKADITWSSSLHLPDVFTLMQDHFQQVEYNPERYCAVKIRIPVGEGKPVCCMIFHTGKMQLAGSKTREELQEALQRVGSLLVPNMHRLQPPSHATSAIVGKRKRKVAVELASKAGRFDDGDVPGECAAACERPPRSSSAALTLAPPTANVDAASDDTNMADAFVEAPAAA